MVARFDAGGVGGDDHPHLAGDLLPEERFDRDAEPSARRLDLRPGTRVLSAGEAGLGEPDALGPRELPSDRPRGGLHRMAEQRRRLEAVPARWLAELDERETTEGDGATSWPPSNRRLASS